jgi:hypothetical protein
MHDPVSRIDTGRNQVSNCDMGRRQRRREAVSESIFDL